MSNTILVVLCVSQAIQALVLVWLFAWLRGHDRVLNGLPDLLKARDAALVIDAERRFRRATFEEFDRVLTNQANEKARRDADAAKVLMDQIKGHV